MFKSVKRVLVLAFAMAFVFIAVFPRFALRLKPKKFRQKRR